MKLLILSNEMQYRLAVRHLGSLKDYTVICDNILLHSFLERNSVRYLPLDVFSIRDRWQDINQWGCQQASSWIHISSESGCFSDVNLVAQMHHNFSYVLVQTLKNYLFAKSLIETYAPDEVAVFSNIPMAKFPACSSGIMINYFLNMLCQERAIPARDLRFEDDDNQKRLKPQSPKGLKQRLKRMTAKILAATMRPKANFEILLVGSPKNMCTLAKELNRRRISAAYFSDDFHFTPFLFALRHRLNYFFSDCINGPRHLDTDALVSMWFREIKTAFEHAESKHLFRFDSLDFAPFLRHYFLRDDGLGPYLAKLASRAAICNQLVKTARFNTLLVDEDISVERSFLASFLKVRGIQTFALSHANFIVDFAVEQSERFYALSKTFVQSPFEKYGYENRGWAPQNVLVTGTPKYDLLYAMKRKREPQRKTSSKMKVFCCGSAPFQIDPPDKVAYLGHSLTYRGNVETPSLVAFFKCIQRYPIELIYKSRNVDDGPRWREFLKRNGISRGVRIVGRKTDSFKLLDECDVMVLSYWSTAIQEAGLLGKPVILLDLFGIFSVFRQYQMNKSFFDYEFCRYVRNEMELDQAIGKLYQDFRNGREAQAQIPPDMIQYYLGPLDGQSTNRVVDLLIQRGIDFTAPNEKRILTLAEKQPLRSF